jgi:hypothetical protein
VRPDDRQGLVINAKEYGGNSQTLIDVKYAMTSTDQYGEAVYGAGTLSSNRILIYTGTSTEDNENPAANYDLVSRLVRNYDDYPYNMYLIRSVVPASESKPLIFNVEEQSKRQSKAPNSEQVSERAFREMEFWFAYVASLDPELYNTWSPPKAENFLNIGYGHFTDVGTFQVREGFSEFGAFVWVLQPNGEKDRLTELWRTNRMQLNRLFNAAEMALETRPDQSPTLT